jgi:hypothetical protein
LVLDEKITSHSQRGQVARAHLRDPIVLAGTTIAAAGSPVDVTVVDSSGAQTGNVDGWVQIEIGSLHLRSGGSLPLFTPTSHIDPHLSDRAANAQAVTDTVGDIFIPYHYLYHVLRKGMDVTLAPGTLIRARTSATVQNQNDRIVVSTPPPFPGSVETPHPDFSPAELYEPPGFVPPTPKPTRSVAPSPSPTR